MTRVSWPFASRGVRVQTELSHFQTVSILAVAIVLVLGLATMARGKSANTSQLLMRWRVGLQFVAVVCIMVVYWLRH